MTHPLAWLAWLSAAALSVLLTRNPLYLILLFGIFYLVLDTVSDERHERLLPISPVRFALFTVSVGALFNGLTSHVGETVVLRLPEQLPLVGGAITAEALAFGAINGLVLAALFGAFAVLNAAVPVRDLIGYLPRAFYPMAVVSAIGVAFVPNTLRQFRQVREAQAVRGHQMRGLRDWLPLFMPVLIGGLERALQLAETMTARGFAGGRDAPAPASVEVALISGLLAVLGGGVLRLVPDYAVWSPILVVVGVALVVYAIWRAGRAVRRTRYRRAVWSLPDAVAVVGGLVSVVALLIWATTRHYTPYPEIGWPAFDLYVGVALLGLTAPAFLVSSNEVDGV